MAALTDTELAGLDLIIAAKKAGTLPAGFINDVANITGAIVNVTAAVAAVTAVAAGAAAALPAVAAPAGGAAAAAGLAPGGGISLDALLNVRKDAIAERNAGNP